MVFKQGTELGMQDVLRIDWKSIWCFLQGPCACNVDSVKMMARALKQGFPCIGEGLAPQAVDKTLEQPGFKQDVAHVVIVRMGRNGLTQSNANKCRWPVVVDLQTPVPQTCILLAPCR